jgi:hypothetical protein
VACQRVTLPAMTAARDVTRRRRGGCLDLDLDLDPDPGGRSDMGTSSADPHKLDEYATEGVELVSTLRTKVNDVADALDALSASSSEHLPQYPGLGELLTDLVDDWAHQDEFVGDVAHGFFAANGGSDSTEAGTVLTFDNETLLTAGEIGYADRDEAIAAAEEMADELDRLREQEDGASAEEMDALVAMAARGQYDSAFAVTFSEQVGAEGYADATAMFEAAYPRDDREAVEAIPQVAVLSTLLTTALDTVPQGEGEYRDPSNADLPAEGRLDSDFVHDLTTGYQPDDMKGPGEHTWGHTGPDDLSLVIGMSDPPTEVAIQIAENRMEPLLRPGGGVRIEGSEWPEGVRDPAVNYATMLARNPDASAGWLIGEGNIELALDTSDSQMADGGVALADVVEAGLTNDDMEVPSGDMQTPSGGGLIREELMDRAITFIGDQDEGFDIRNEHMYDALASGVEANMSVIDERVNEGWSPDGQSYTHNGDDSMSQTEDFLTELMGDDGARDRIVDATNSYVQDQLDDLDADDVGAAADDRDHRLNELGRVLGFVSDTDIDVMTAGFEQDQSAAANPGKIADYIVSWIPVAGEVNDAAGVIEQSVGKWIEQGLSPDSQEFKDNLRNLLMDQREQIEVLDLPSDDIAQIRRGADDGAKHSD